MKRCVLAVFLLLLLIPGLVFAQTNKPWRQYGAKYKHTTGGVSETAHIYRDVPFSDENNELFRCKRFWCYNGTGNVVYLVRWRYRYTLDDSIDINVTTRIYLDQYTTNNPTMGIPLQPGQTFVSDLGFDGIYYLKLSGIASEPFVWEAMR